MNGRGTSDARKYAIRLQARSAEPVGMRVTMIENFIKCGPCAAPSFNWAVIIPPFLGVFIPQHWHSHEHLRSVPKITRKLCERLQPEGWKAYLVE